MDTTDARLAEFLLKSAPTVYQYDTFEMRHPSWLEPLLFVRNCVRPLTALDELGVSKTYLYFPLTIEKSGLNTNLDYTLKLNIQDVGFVNEKLRVLTEADFLIKPTLIYRSYTSDDLTAPLVRVKLSVARLPMDSLSCTIEAEAPRMNTNGTGLRFLPSIFTGLRPLT